MRARNRPCRCPARVRGGALRRARGVHPRSRPKAALRLVRVPSRCHSAIVPSDLFGRVMANSGMTIVLSASEEWLQAVREAAAVFGALAPLVTEVVRGGAVAE